MREMYGREVLYSDEKEINQGNVVDVFKKTFRKHLINREDIQYLYNYYKGKQSILNRNKTVRPEICNKVVENRANEIVAFKVGYLCGEPIQYVGRSADEKVSEGIASLNEMMYSQCKSYLDREVVEWQMISGTAYRLILPSPDEECPFRIYTLDPRTTYIVYSSDVQHEPLMAVTYRKNDNGEVLASVYSRSTYWEIEGEKIIREQKHALNCVPVFEYPANNARLGAFEIVLPLLDAMNTVESNRLDGVEQFVQAFVKFINCNIDKDDFAELKELGAIKVFSSDGQPADVDMISNELDQSQTQVLVDHLYQTVLTICGIPNRNGGSSTSDTGSAVVLRDGWSLAESRAKDSELMFKKSEQAMLKLILRICSDSESGSEVAKLGLKDIALQFTRRNYENVQSKAQVLVSMLTQDKIHPRLAFTSCGLFSDPEQAYSDSMDYYEKIESELLNELEEGAKCTNTQTE